MARMTIDDAPLNGFHLRVTAYTTAVSSATGTSSASSASR